jgi:lysine 2,3-aminomutase
MTTSISETAAAFRQRHFPEASDTDWCDWRWQLRHRLQELEDLAAIVELTDAERTALTTPGSGRRPFPVSITPYYASLLDPDNPQQGLRKTVIPRPDEYVGSPGELEDPLGEDDHSPVPGIVHRYPDRALFLVTDYCPVYCRYCTRSRLVGGGAPFQSGKPTWQRAIDYIAATPAIRDVLVSGGDPLVYDDAQLDWLLSRLHAIPHLEMIRIGSKIPMVMPQRITPALCNVLKRYHPLYMSIHVTHPDELTPEVATACNRLADAGVVMGSQTVLLKDVNDDAETIRSLMHGLLRMRIRPYYLLQCDAIHGSGHFRTPIQSGIDLIKSLRGHTTGYAVPHFIVDLPAGGGKISLDPDYLTGHDGEFWQATNYLGEGYRYYDPAVSPKA